MAHTKDSAFRPFALMACPTFSEYHNEDSAIAESSARRDSNPLELWNTSEMAWPRRTSRSDSDLHAELVELATEVASGSCYDSKWDWFGSDSQDISHTASRAESRGCSPPPDRELIRAVTLGVLGKHTGEEGYWPMLGQPANNSQRSDSALSHADTPYADADMLPVQSPAGSAPSLTSGGSTPKSKSETF